MILLDTVRVLLALVGGIIAAYQVALIRSASTNGQRARLAGIAGAAAILSGSRLQNLGAPLTWQFVGTAAVFVALAYGSWKWRDEIPAQPRRRAGPFGPTNPHRPRPPQR